MDTPVIPEDHEIKAYFLRSSPVFNTERNVDGVEVSYSCLGPCTLDETHAGAFHWLVSDGLDEVERLADEYGRLYVPLEESLLNAPEVGKLPWDRCTLVVRPEPMVSEEFLDSCNTIRTSGYRLAVNLGFLPTGLDGLLELADLFMLDLGRMRPTEMVSVYRQIQPYGTPVMAIGLDTWDDFAGAKALGATLFQGAFFGRPEVVKGLELQANSLARLELMRAIQDDNTTFKAIASIIATDAFLSYRLLSFVNSPSLAPGREVKSIEHAVALLGFEPFKQWALMALVSSLDASPKGEMLAYLALQRGSFLSKLAALTPECPYPPQKIFLLGLFSLLDAMLSHPMQEVVASIPMDASIKAALCGKKSPALGWLNLLNHIDANRWQEVTAFLQAEGISCNLAAKAYFEASRWAKVCFQSANQEEPKA